eukprot:TRINITY_DN2636_c0_g3_i9.p1 TRINITY_DN2636_c0_g3~~TRINITY_DN2636_c0_g3_i9.p1  ORF type:complete len:327 (-),score=58.23 TRINITY_DN2636_c0_g3_i9:1403-2383(-)
MSVDEATPLILTEAVCEPDCFALYNGSAWVVDVGTLVNRDAKVRFDPQRKNEDIPSQRSDVLSSKPQSILKTPIAVAPALLNPLEFSPDWRKPDEAVFWVPPASSKSLVHCRIVRLRKDGDVAYYMHLDDPSQTFLMASVKRKDSGTSNFSITTAKSDFRKESPYYLGRIRSRLGRKLFSVYGRGENPSKCRDSEKHRLELGAVSYISTPSEVLPCRMIVCLPEVDENSKPLIWKPSNGSNGLLDKFYQNQFEGMMILETKDPAYDEARKVYSLDFQGRVKVASLKNFQLHLSTEPDQVTMQFGRIDKDSFIVDFKYPLNAYQVCV